MAPQRYFLRRAPKEGSGERSEGSSSRRSGIAPRTWSSRTSPARSLSSSRARKHQSLPPQQKLAVSSPAADPPSEAPSSPSAPSALPEGTPTKERQGLSDGEADSIHERPASLENRRSPSAIDFGLDDDDDDDDDEDGGDDASMADEASVKVWSAYQRWRVTKIRLDGIPHHRRDDGSLISNITTSLSTMLGGGTSSAFDDDAPFTLERPVSVSLLHATSRSLSDVSARV